MFPPQHQHNHTDINHANTFIHKTNKDKLRDAAKKATGLAKSTIPKMEKI